MQHKPYFVPLLCAGVGFVLLVVLGLVYTKMTAPGIETQALEQQMRPLIGQSFETVAAQFGTPDDDYYPNLHGSFYVAWVYRRKDGQVRIMGAVRDNRVEWVFAERQEH